MIEAPGPEKGLFVAVSIDSPTFLLVAEPAKDEKGLGMSLVVNAAGVVEFALPANIELKGPEDVAEWLDTLKGLGIVCSFEPAADPVGLVLGTVLLTGSEEEVMPSAGDELVGTTTGVVVIGAAVSGAGERKLVEDAVGMGFKVVTEFC